MKVLFIQDFYLQVQKTMLQVEFLPPRFLWNNHPCVDITHEDIPLHKPIKRFLQRPGDRPCVQCWLVNDIQ